MTLILFLLLIGMFVYVRRLEERIDHLEQGVDQGTKKTVAPVVSPMPSGPAFAKVSATSATKEFQKGTIPVHQLAQTTAENKNKSANHEESDVEARLATNWASRIGALAILLGVGFFFKYAIDQNWIGPALRIAIGIIVGALLNLLGWLWRNKYPKYADSLLGGGAAILYFSFFAAYSFYGLISQSVALIFMILVAVLTVIESFRKKSVALAVLSGIGAYGAPLFLGFGSTLEAQLLLYISGVNIVTVAIWAKLRRYEVLIAAAFGTALTIFAWVVRFDTQGGGLMLLFLGVSELLIAILPVMISVWQNHNVSASGKGLGITSALFSAFVWMVGTLAYLGHYHSQFVILLLLSGLGLVCAYVAAFDKENDALNLSLSGAGIGLLLLASGYQWHGEIRILAWIVLSVIALASAVGVKRSELRLWSLSVLVITTLFSFDLPFVASSMAFLNPRFGLMLLEVCVFGLSAYSYNALPEKPFEKSLTHLLHMVWSIMLWLIIFFEFGYAGGIGMLLYWRAGWTIVFTAALVLFAAQSRSLWFSRLAIIFLVFSSIFSILLPFNAGDYLFLFNVRFVLLVLQVLLLLYAGSVLHDPAELSDQHLQLKEFFKTVAVVFLWFVVSQEIVVHGSVGSTNIRNLFLSFWWILYGIALLVVGVMRKDILLRKLGIGALALSVVKVFLYDSQALDTVYRIVAFIVLGVLLLVVSFGYQKNKEKVVEFLEGETGKKIS